MSTFAGFWVDGAVRKPEQRHFSKASLLVVRWKSSGEPDTATPETCCWDELFWLDTTPRESLTPEELFSVLKVIWPKCEAVFAPDFASAVQWQITNEATDFQTPITWDEATQYPPPVEPQWVRITRENVGQYLFRECRFWIIPRGDKKTWNGVIVGWCPTDNVCLVESDYNESESILRWDVVEVQNAN